MSKKLRVKDLKKDEVRTEVVHAMSWAADGFSRHRRVVLGAAGGLIVLALGTASVMALRQGRKVDSEALLGSAMRKLDQRLEAPPPPGAPPAKTPPSWDEVRGAFEQAAQEHPGTPAALVAAEQLGAVELRMGDAAAASATLATFAEKNPQHWAAPHALALLAAAQESTGHAPEAEQTLRKLADGTWRSFPRAAALMKLGELYERQGDVAKARETYETLSKEEEHADTPYATQAGERLRELGTPST